MVATLDWMESGREFETLDEASDFVSRAEGVARALYEQHWRFDDFEVGVTKFIGPARWV